MDFEKQFFSGKEGQIRAQRFETIIAKIKETSFKEFEIPSQEGASLKTENFIQRKTDQWRRTPWYVRASAEVFGIGFIVLLVVTFLPRLNQVYQQSLDRRLENFNLQELAFDVETSVGVADEEAFEDENEVISYPSSQYTPTLEMVARSYEQGTGIPEYDYPEQFMSSNRNFLATVRTEIAVETELAPAVDTEVTEAPKPTPRRKEKIFVGNSEIWRFIIRSESPSEMKPLILKTLTEAGISENTEGFGGREAPGGIQFDILVPKKAIVPIKETLESIAAGETSPSAPRSSFTWYKNKRHRGIPPGRARVVIWLSQI